MAASPLRDAGLRRQDEPRRFGRVCVFCGSSPGRNPQYRQAAEATGRLMAERGFELVFGGGSVGLMGAVSDALLAAGGRAIGVIPGALAAREIAHRGLTELRITPSMHARKALMAELSDAFLALPGGFGTFEELFETITWVQLGIHDKPVGLLNVGGYFDPMVTMVDRAVAEGFIRPEYRSFLVVGTEPGPLLDDMARVELPAVPRWVRPDQE